MSEKPPIPAQEIDRAYAAIDKVLQPLTHERAETEAVADARDAFHALQLMRQWARLGATVDAAGLFCERVKLQAAELVAAGKLTPENAEAFVGALAGKKSKKRRG